MLSDPQSVTYAGATLSLPATGRTIDTSTYQVYVSGVDYILTVQHKFAKRNRAVVRLQRSSFASDPLVPANSVLASMSATLTIDFPPTGLTISDASNLAAALLGFCGTSGLVARIVGGET